MRRVIAALIFALVFMAFWERPALADVCLDCHEEKTPGVVGFWKDSAHFKARVTCERCHGSDVRKSHAGQAVVGAELCGSCHEDEDREHGLSKHSIGMKTGQGCTRNLPESREKNRTCSHCHERGSSVPIVDTECAMFLAQSPSMQRQGCSSCHRVEQRCDTCHTRHGTDTALAGRAETCGVCHMGPDHAQLEMWRTSAHGVLYEAGKNSPTCVTCHMAGGTHNVSLGIATGQPSHRREAVREAMIDICSNCHTRKMASRSLEDADNIEQESSALVAEASEIVEALAREGLLKPSVMAREPHPLFGQSLVIGPHMLYENISSVEARLFRMKMFHYMSAFKGAFHQNPDYSHWFGNAPLKLALSEIKSEAATLREIGSLRKRLDNMGPGGSSPGGEDADGRLKHDLRELNDRLYKGEISEEEHRKEKTKLLDDMGL